MRKIVLFVLLSVCLSKAQAQSFEVQQLILNVEKLAQLKQILTDLKDGYEIVSKGYNAVRDVSKGNFDLHSVFLDGLMQVSPTVRRYRKVAEITGFQVRIVKEYKTAYRVFLRSNLFNSAEIGYLNKVYDNLFQKSLKHLDDLTTVITAGQLRMSDDERLQAIDGIYDQMQDKLSFLRHFNNSTGILAVQRSKQQSEVSRLQKLFDVKK
ncbi:TerB family tellurite resistance protein [Filimonas effusa]|uniref:TerB family tellurite resistance protein n=1 Tax=Filimonas effusa TaxID=2508721 RepID=A0A4Q1D0T7_9BACT|nr:TerB family tellurite resistance protein [Filimonas effusa]RXK81292.1 TerB family tellurite resistance protein [Filimonas effusa]